MARRFPAGITFIVAGIISVTLVTGCGSESVEDSKPAADASGQAAPSAEETPTAQVEPVELRVSSTGFSPGAAMPVRYAKETVADGRNVSPALQWTGAPASVASFALVMVDRHPIADNWVHWMVVDIPATTTALQENASGALMPIGARELANTFGETGYGGPSPPPGSGPHSYEITVYGLSVNKLDLPDAASLEAFESAVSDVTVVKGSIVGTFEQ